MKKIITIILTTITLGFSFIPTPTSAANKGESCQCVDGSTGTVVVDTNILTGCDCTGANTGGSVTNILDLVINIMTIGIGILGVIGITIVGIQYLTAGGNEEKTRKAKHRMFEIVIGLVAYVVIYAALKWLMPHMP